MRVRLNVVLSATIVVSVGFITLLGLLAGSDLRLIRPLFASLPLDEASIDTIVGVLSIVPALAAVFVRIAVVTAALTLIIGILNLLFVHARRFAGGARGLGGRVNSLALLLSYSLGVIFIILGRVGDSNIANVLLESVQVTIESALAALLFFVLVYGAMRILRRGVTFGRLLFLAALLIVLIGALPLGIAPVRDFAAWVMAVPVDGGARGILLGIALATSVAGLRILIGQDRSYGE
jgi:hypothetical protein